MITLYKNTKVGLETITDLQPGCWINMIDPTPDEITRTYQELEIPQDFLTYPLDVDELSRTEKEDGATLIILRVPHFQGKNLDVPYTTLPMGIVLTENYFVTVCRQENCIIREFASGKVRGLSTVKKNRFVLRLMLWAAYKYLSYLREITKVTDTLEDELQQSTRNREVLELLKYQKSLTYFTTALKSNQLMLERLQKSHLFDQYPDDEDWLEDVITENQQAIAMTDIAGNILSQMMDAFASIISNNLNMVMKMLASITIIMSLPTMLASFYGMNVNLPLDEHPVAFLAILAVSFVLSLGAAFIFWRKDWL